MGLNSGIDDTDGSGDLYTVRGTIQVTDSSDVARQLGAALGENYAVERPLGEGGFAVVFLVRDLALKRSLAVKVLSPDMITSKAVLERFRREAETVAQLSHPNIVPLHFIGQQGDLLYIAMQCVDGGSIADRLKLEGTLPVAEAVRVASEVASALEHAHKRGVIHRDIKPANVLVDAESGRSLVTDFGIARSANTKGLTATGMMMGTPAYLSPEQVTGEPVDHRVDIFALGVMLFEMLTGRVPYEAPTPGGAMMKRLGGPPQSVTTLRADVPKRIANVITGCLMADPDHRFQSATEVIHALGGAAITSKRRAMRNAPTVRGGSRRKWIAGVATMLAVTGGVWTLRLGRPSRAAPVVSAPATSTALVDIPAGDYIIGRDDGPPLTRPRHNEHVGAFRMERTEVTVNDFGKFIAATHAPPPWSGSPPQGTLPVTRVPWGDAENYCTWKYPGRGRLPTEVEWESAARGRAGRSFAYGEAAGPARANTASAGRKAPVPVGSFPRGATPEGLEDMSGNVWEWTASALVSYPGTTPLPDSMAQYRVIRGGAFDTDDSVASGWMRGYLKSTAPAAQLAKTGFRCLVSD